MKENGKNFDATKQNNLIPFRAELLEQYGVESAEDFADLMYDRKAAGDLSGVKDMADLLTENESNQILTILETLFHYDAQDAEQSMDSFPLDFFLIKEDKKQKVEITFKLKFEVGITPDKSEREEEAISGIVQILEGLNPDVISPISSFIPVISIKKEAETYNNENLDYKYLFEKVQDILNHADIISCTEMDAVISALKSVWLLNES